MYKITNNKGLPQAIYINGNYVVLNPGESTTREKPVPGLLNEEIKTKKQKEIIEGDE